MLYCSPCLITICISYEAQHHDMHGLQLFRLSLASHIRCVYLLAVPNCEARMTQHMQLRWLQGSSLHNACMNEGFLRYAQVQEPASEEIGILRTEVARLQQPIAASIQQLEAASAAAEAERSTSIILCPATACCMNNTVMESVSLS